jgi:hypothetical protein
MASKAAAKSGGIGVKSLNIGALMARRRGAPSAATPLALRRRSANGDVKRRIDGIVARRGACASRHRRGRRDRAAGALGALRGACNDISQATGWRLAGRHQTALGMFSAVTRRQA